MGVMASWGPMTFKISPSGITALSGLTTGYNRKSDTNEDTSGQPTTNTRGLDLQNIQLDVSYIRGLGVDPRSMIDRWKSQFFKKYPLYVGGQRFGPKFLELDSVNVGSVILDNNGDFIQVDLSISLTEYVPPETTASEKNSTEPEASSKTGALNAGASSADKAAKKTVKVR